MIFDHIMRIIKGDAIVLPLVTRFCTNISVIASGFVCVCDSKVQMYPTARGSRITDNTNLITLTNCLPLFNTIALQMCIEGIHRLSTKLVLKHHIVAVG